MTKRSPILGYNHNIRYRGVVFHVQTEDSGVLSPHLFTHLFHGGVIVSTRKLVYDAGANEEAIKALMQAQHKAVMKELRKGAFDDKIDEYLAGTEGLEPRTGGGGAAKGAPEATARAAGASERPGTEPIDLERDAISAEPLRPAPSASTPPPTDSGKARTITASRGSSGVRAMLPPEPSDALDPPTLTDDPAAIAGAMPSGRGAKLSRAATPPPIPTRGAARTPVRAGPPLPRDASDAPLDSSPEISISIEGEASGRSRMPRDTEVETPLELEAGIPGAITTDDLTRPSEGIPWHASETPSAPAGERRPTTGDRPPSHGAATLPPVARPVTRPPSRPAMTPPTVMSRPPQDPRRRDSDAVEVYAPPPGSADPPPGERAERPGQYSVSRTKQHSIPADVPLRDSTGRIAIPAGLGRPRASSSTGRPAQTTPPSAMPGRTRPPDTGMRGSVSSIERGDTIDQMAIDRTPTPTRGPATTAPISSRTGSPSQSGVVMTRPAVIVGAPNKPGASTQRIRKAREDEGRGFGQGLISEKSLDEVILAYLSEDAEEK